MTDIKRLVSEVTAAPLGEIIAAVGGGVASAQRALDDQAIQQVLALYADGDEAARLMRESGWRPTFYAIPEAEGEIKVSLVVSGSTSGGGSTQAAAASSSQPLPVSPHPVSPQAVLAQKGRVSSMLAPKLYATPVDAGYRNRYDYEGSVTASVSFRIVPVPAPPGAERIRVVPGIVGLSAALATERLEDYDLTIELAGLVDQAAEEGVAVVEQSPTAGERVQEGDVIVATLGKPAES